MDTNSTFALIGFFLSAASIITTIFLAVFANKTNKEIETIRTSLNLNLSRISNFEQLQLDKIFEIWSFIHKTNRKFQNTLSQILVYSIKPFFPIEDAALFCVGCEAGIIRTESDMNYFNHSQKKMDALKVMLIINGSDDIHKGYDDFHTAYLTTRFLFPPEIRNSVDIIDGYFYNCKKVVFNSSLRSEFIEIIDTNNDLVAQKIQREISALLNDDGFNTAIGNLENQIYALYDRNNLTKQTRTQH